MITISLAKESDFKVIQDLEISAKSEIYHAGTDEDIIKDYIQKGQIYLGYLDNKLIGEISFRPTEYNGYYIDGFVVDEEYRTQGYGTHIFRSLLAKFGNKKVELVVHPKNTHALVVYLKCGFIVTDYLENHIGDQPRLMMCKEVKNSL